MTIHKSGGRKLLSRVLAAGVLVVDVRLRHGCHDRRLGCLPGLCATRSRPGCRSRPGWRLGARRRRSRRGDRHRRRCGRHRRRDRGGSGAAAATQSTIVCSASGRTIPRAGPIWVTTATAIPVRDGWTIACTYFRTPARCRVFLFFRCVAPDNSLATMCLHRAQFFSTMRPTTFPARSSSIHFWTSAIGSSFIGVGLILPARASAINSLASASVPTMKPSMVMRL